MRSVKQNRDGVASERCDEAFPPSEKPELLDAHMNDFHSENHSRPRRADSGSKARARAGNEQYFSFFRADFETRGDLIRKACADLYGSSFPSRGATEQVSEDGSQ